MLFTLDDVAESMERESLDVGIASMLEALDHATGALLNVLVPFGRVLFGPASCPFLPLYTFCIRTIVSLQSLIARSGGNHGSFINRRKPGTASSRRHGYRGR